MPRTNSPIPARRRWRHPHILIGSTIAAILLTAGLVISSTSAAAESGHHHSTSQPTVVLVHGAWADSSSWDKVVRRLQHDGYPVAVFPTPLRSLAGDSARLRAYLAEVAGPIVLVGHSFGGAITTDAATGNQSVKALVYLDAFAPDTGDTTTDLVGPTSALANPDPTQVFNLVPATLPPTPRTDLYVKTDVFLQAFANDLPRREGMVLAATQRPVTLGALSEPSKTPAWRTIPSWYEIGTIDNVIPPTQQAFMAHRAHARIVNERTGHLPMVSKPDAVTRLIEMAARAAL